MFSYSRRQYKAADLMVGKRKSSDVRAADNTAVYYDRKGTEVKHEH